MAFQLQADSVAVLTQQRPYDKNVNPTKNELGNSRLGIKNSSTQHGNIKALSHWVWLLQFLILSCGLKSLTFMTLEV